MKTREKPNVRPPPSGTEAGERADRGQLVQSIVRALSVLRVLGEANAGLTLTEVANMVGLTPSTTHRLLTTLQQERFVRFDAATRVWSIGVQAFITGNGFLKTRDIIDLARPRMRRLMEETGETVNLGVEENGEVIYLAQVECRQMMRALAPPGARTLMHCSAVGKALLSAMPMAVVMKTIERHGLPRLTPSTLTTMAALQADLETVRQRGFAIDDEEHALGLRCVAATLFDEKAVAIRGFSLSGPMVRIADERLRKLGEEVKRAATDITREFGGRMTASPQKDMCMPAA